MLAGRTGRGVGAEARRPLHAAGLERPPPPRDPKTEAVHAAPDGLSPAPLRGSQATISYFNDRPDCQRNRPESDAVGRSVPAPLFRGLMRPAGTSSRLVVVQQRQGSY